MTELHKTVATLRFFGEDLDPEEITQLLGANPTVGAKKGGTWLTELGAEKVAHKGQWRLTVERRSPGDLDGQVAELFDTLTTDLDIWKDLSARFQADVFCGLFMSEFNEGISLSPDTLVAVGSRGLSFDMDIYGPNGED